MTAHKLPLLLLLALVMGDNKCLGPGDCNARNCEDCKCENGACECADGWSGDHCATPACTDRASCSDHGNCSMTMEKVECECDAGYEGTHCEQAKCNCQHGGTPDAKCTQCTGCLGAWGGKFCDVWDDSVPLADLIAKLEVISNASQAALNALPAQTMCKQGHECVGWGVDGVTGKPTMFPVVALTYDPTRTDKIFHGKMEPLEVEATPNSNPTWAFNPVAGQADTHAFATIGEFSGYVDATYAGAGVPRGTSGFSVYTMSKQKVLEQFYQQPGQDTALTVVRAVKSFITMDLPFDPATKTQHWNLDRHAKDAALSLPASYETDAHKQQFQWFTDRYGTSYARTASMGALIEQRARWQTPLRDENGFDAAKLTKNANIDFANSTGLNGPGSAPDASYTAGRTLDPLECVGGDPTISCDADMKGWMASVDTADSMVLLDFDIHPISTLLPGDIGPSFETALQAHLAEQRAAWTATDKCPASCNSRGFCRAPASVQCTCACYFGNGCSGSLKPGCKDTCSDGSSNASCAAWRQLFDSTNGNAWGSQACAASRQAPSGCLGVRHSGADITEIALPNLGLEGTLPPSLGQLTAMTRLALMGNSLYGEVPDLSGATSLERLELNNNAFSGTVPSSLGAMAGLQELWLSQNNFSGFGDALTQGFGSCTIASSGQPCCDLSDNEFSCPLPTWLNSSKCVATCMP